MVECVFVLLSLPVLVELTLFIFSNFFLRTMMKHRPGSDIPAEKPLSLAILIPAHEEEKTIERCVRSALSSNPGIHTREVIVIADNCQDSTAIRARKAGARVLERFDAEKRGKGAALDYAISSLSKESHDAYLIIDADTVVSEDFIKTMGNHFSCGEEALQCVYLPLNTDASPKIRLMNLALLSMNVFRPLGREYLGCSVGILGNGFGLSKKLLSEVQYSANSIAEDLEYHIKLIQTGHKVRFVIGARVLSDFPISKEGSDTQRARWEGGRLMLQRKLFLPLLHGFFSGKWAILEPFLELMSLPLSYEVLILCALIAIPGKIFPVYGFCGLGIILIQMVSSVVLYGDKKDFRAFLEIPGYLFWKIIKLPSILLNSRKDAKWVRTKRD